ncbi:hypothetical protein [Acinetobacter soli]|uniref:hypothetical protein n=1 Tax=Acinetobacter soli TaxID=487316 RepID=UPI00124FC92A|nr:hypothetical protein [Acinetobacter soli]
MSIVLLVLTLLTAFFYFFQSVIVRYNNELVENDITMLKHRTAFYEAVSIDEINESVKQHLKASRAYLDVCKRINGRITLLEFLLVDAKISSSELEEARAEKRELASLSPELMEIEKAVSIHMFRTLVINASVLLFIFSPIMILAIIYRFLSGRNIPIEESTEKLYLKHC